jgi:type I restriction enzyme S subunit
VSGDGKRRDWRQVKLMDVCQEITVGHVGPMADQYVDSGVTFLRSQNIRPFRLNLADVKFITPEFHAKLKKSSLKPGDVIVVRTGYPGTACVVPEALQPANCADFVVIRPSPNLDSWFLSCIFNSTLGRGTVAGSLVGVAQQHFNIGVARQMVIKLPPLLTQRRITAILSSYDELIENNTRRIQVLERMAGVIYREWFINFRFPSHEKVRFVDSTSGKIPHGWAVVKVKQLVRRLPSGTVYTASEVGGTGRVPVIDQSTSDVLGYHDNPADHRASANSPVVIFGDHTCKLRILVEPFSIGPNVVPFVAGRDFSTAYLFFLVQNLVETKEYKRHWTDLINKVVVIGHTEVAQQFADTVEPILVLERSLRLKNANLRRTRDLLLPKLISGELDVAEATIERL